MSTFDWVNFGVTLSSLLAQLYSPLVSCPNGSCLMCRLRGLYLDSALREPRNARQNLIGGLSPRERLLIRLMRIDEGLNGGLQLGHTVMRPATQLFVGQFREPTLPQTQPQPLGGRAMNVKTW